MVDEQLSTNSLSPLRDMLEADVIMSPARRSLRLTEKCDTPRICNRGNYQVVSLTDLPVDLDIGYLPNKALVWTSYFLYKLFNIIIMVYITPVFVVM